MSLESVYRYIKSEACRPVGRSAVTATNNYSKGAASPLSSKAEQGVGVVDKETLSSRIVRENVLSRNR